MLNKFTKSITIQASDSDYASILSYPDIFALSMDIATEHSEHLKYDGRTLAPKGLFWVTTKYRVHIYRRPKQGECVDLTTWPEKPNRIRGIRNYRFTKNDETLIEIISEWAVLDRNNNRLYMIDQLYDPSFVFCEEKQLTDGFHRFTSEFGKEPFAEYTVRSIDIDFEGHMNNVAYLRALFGLFTRDELEKMSPTEVEVYFKTSCFEGDRLLWKKHETKEGLELCACLDEGKDIFYARLK